MGGPASPLAPAWPGCHRLSRGLCGPPSRAPCSSTAPTRARVAFSERRIGAAAASVKKCSGDVSRPLWCNHKSRLPPTLVREPLRLCPRLHSCPLPVSGHGAMPAIRGPCVWNSHGSWPLTIPCVCRITLGAFTTLSAVIAITPPAAFPVWIHKDAEASGTLRNRLEVLQSSSGAPDTGAWPPDPHTASVPGRASDLLVLPPLGMRWSALRAAGFEGGTPGATESCGLTSSPPGILPTHVRPPDTVCWKQTCARIILGPGAKG